MKKGLLFLAVLLFAMAMCAQDVIITKEGDALKVFEIEVSNKFVFYKESSNADAPIKRVAKQDLLMIKYNDGRKEIIGDDDAPAPSNTPSAAPAEKKGEVATPVSCTDDEANAAAIERINSLEVKHIAKPQDKEANILYYQCKIKEESIIADKNMELDFKCTVSKYNMTFPFPKSSSLTVIARNRSNKTIYIDLGETFLIRDSESIQCYVPSATSQTNGSTTGGSVNMGAVAGALGVGGSLGSLANGINVGGATSSATTTTTFTQRVVPVPPMSERVIGTLDIIPMDNREVYRSLKYKRGLSGILENMIHTYFNNGEIPTVGEERANNKELVRFGAFITYSENEEQTTPHTLNALFDIKKIIGLKAKKFVTDKMLDKKDLSPNYEDAIYFLAYPKEL